MKISPLDVVLVALFLVVAIVGGYLKVLTPQLVATIITGALAFLAMRIKVLGGAAVEEKDAKSAKDEEKPQELTDGTPDKPLEGHHSHRLLIGDNGSVKVEDVTPEPKTLPDEHKIVEPPK